EDIAVRADGTLNLDIWATGAGSDPRFDYAYINAFELQPVPEPATATLIGLGLAVLVVVRRRSR
ncbi:MAG: PEP-CTERM sorting domain-containing protein, partial [Planctomycetota bacterium]|nr:PEP-CTERM sorting domain-containing protein [Planctomycetota bacterium]